MTEQIDSDTSDVFKDRAKFLEQLQKEVNSAFDNRAVETPAEGTDSTIEQLTGIEKFAKELEGKKDDEVIDCGKYQKLPHEVVVYNPHDYKDLIEMAIRKFWNDDDFVKSEVKEMVKHELEHHVALLGVEGVRQVYGIHFFKEKGSGKSNFTRFVGIEGKAPVGLIRKSITDVTNPSSGDRILSNR